jgi:hypothetical protein
MLRTDMRVWAASCSIVICGRSAFEDSEEARGRRGELRGRAFAELRADAFVEPRARAFVELRATCQTIPCLM